MPKIRPVKRPRTRKPVKKKKRLSWIFSPRRKKS